MYLLQKWCSGEEDLEVNLVYRHFEFCQVLVGKVQDVVGEDEGQVFFAFDVVVHLFFTQGFLF